MRNAFAKTLVELAAEEPRLVMLSADIGNRLFDDFKARFPDRFYNVGIAEANMISVAAGLAMNGFKPICYTITPFVTTRCLEQIRVDLCYHRQPVTVVGVGSGLGYAELGATHQACEDVAFLRALPEMTVVAPADCLELRQAMAQAIRLSGPCYLRLGKKGEPDIHAAAPDFRIGQAIVVHPAGTKKDVCLLASGIILPIAVDACRLLQSQGIEVELVSYHTIKPLDEDYLHRAFSEFSLVVALEEHSLIGGLSSAVAEWKADQLDSCAPLLRLGTPDLYLHQAGHQEYAREKLGLTAERVAGAIAKRLALASKKPAGNVHP